MSYQKNTITATESGLVMYVDMNSYFASCEQQLVEKYRDKPIGICPGLGPNAVAIAASKEAKQYGIKTGMRVWECKQLCPGFEMVAVRPVEYRRIHVKIVNILRKYCQDVIPKSIDEAVLNLAPYRYIYKDVLLLAKNIKRDIREQIGEYVTCSIGIAENVFLAKLGTEIQKPDGLVLIDRDNIDTYLSKMQLTDLPGIARASERRLQKAGIYTTLQLRQASESLLRKVFGGVVGNYWYYRLHFMEVDLYSTQYRNMAAARSLSAETRASITAMNSLFISLCTRLEQRMVKQEVACRYIHFAVYYYDHAGWNTSIRLHTPCQDAMEIVEYVRHRIAAYEKQGNTVPVFKKDMSFMSVMVGDFIKMKEVQYGLFDNKMQQDKLRSVVYGIKDVFGKNMVRKASETIEAGQMKDAIGFGSVKDLYEGNDSIFNEDYRYNQFLLEDDVEMNHPTE